MANLTTGHGIIRQEVSRSACLGAFALCLAILSALPLTAQAQTMGDGFLFREPFGSFSLRGGFERANAGSEIFDFTTDQLTLDRGDFSGVNLAADFALRISPRLDAVLGAGFAGSSRRSEFRDFVDGDDLPIEQTTRFMRVPITVGLKGYLLSRGQTVGTLVWIPSRFAPYLGAGAGAIWYSFDQQGDFIDFEDFSVFSSRFQSSGWTPTAHVLAGADYSLNARLALTGEGRYSWARAEMSDDFRDFDRIDLSGLSATLGLRVRF